MRERGRRGTIICSTSETLKSEQGPDCKRHTPMPEGYLDRAEWMEKKSNTHEQVQCPGCKLWKIWVPKKKATTPPRDE